MTSFIYSNLSTIFVALAVLAVVGLAARSVIKDKKSGKSCSCGGSCSGCPGSAACHGRENES